MTRSMGAILRRLSKLEKRVGNSAVSSMPSRRKSSGRLQKCSLFQDAPHPFGHVPALALRQLSDQHLQRKCCKPEIRSSREGWQSFVRQWPGDRRALLRTSSAQRRRPSPTILTCPLRIMFTVSIP